MECMFVLKSLHTMLLYSQNESNVQSNSIQKLYLKMVTPYTKIYKHV